MNNEPHGWRPCRRCGHGILYCYRYCFNCRADNAYFVTQSDPYWLSDQHLYRAVQSPPHDGRPAFWEHGHTPSLMQYQEQNQHQFSQQIQMTQMTQRSAWLDPSFHSPLQATDRTYAQDPRGITGTVASPQQFHNTPYETQRYVSLDDSFGGTNQRNEAHGRHGEPNSDMYNVTGINHYPASADESVHHQTYEQSTGMSRHATSGTDPGAEYQAHKHHERDNQLGQRRAENNPHNSSTTPSTTGRSDMESRQAKPYLNVAFEDTDHPGNKSQSTTQGTPNMKNITLSENADVRKKEHMVFGGGCAGSDNTRQSDKSPDTGKETCDTLAKNESCLDDVCNKELTSVAKRDPASESMHDLTKVKQKEESTQHTPMEIADSHCGSAAEPGDEQQTANQRNRGAKHENSDGCPKGYRKKDQPPQEYIPSNASSKSKSSAATADKEVTVTFVAIPSKDFNMSDDPRLKVFVVFGCEELGGWNERIWGPMHRLRFEDRFSVYEYTTTVPKRLLSSGKPLEYKYAVTYINKEKKIKDALEYIPGPSSDAKAHRHLVIPKSADSWKQYDGIIHKTHHDWKDKFSSFWSWSSRPDKEEAETKKVIKMMLPKLDAFSADSANDSVRAEEVLRDIRHVVHCVNARMRREKMPEDTMKKVLVEYLEPFMQQLRQANTGEAKEKGDDLRIVRAMVISYLVVKFKLLEMVNKNHAKPLCYALLVRSDLAGYKRLEMHFSNKMELADVLEKLMRLGLCGKVHCEPMWVLVIPLYHLLHDDHKLDAFIYKEDAGWWGTAGIEDVVDTFHDRHYCPKSEHITEYQRRLVPLFEHDHKLPRTLMAIVTYNKMDSGNIDCFTPEAIMANIIFALKTSKTIYEREMKDKLSLLLDKVTTRTPLLSEETPEPTLKLAIDIASLQTQISCKLLHEITEYGKRSNNAATIVTMVRVAFACLNKMSEFRKQSSEYTTDKDCQTVEEHFVKEVAGMTVSWMRKVFIGKTRSVTSRFPDTQEMETYTDMLNMTTIEKLEQVWKDRILSVLYHRYSELKPMEKVEIYCNVTFSKYHPYIEEYFTNMAFDAVEDLCKEGFDKLLESGNVSSWNAGKIKNILSKVFSQMWHQDTDETKILDLVLTWPAFPRFLDILHGKSSLLTEDMHIRITSALSIYTDVVSRLSSGNIEVKTVQKLVDNRQNVLAIQKCIDSHSEGDSASSTDIAQYEMLDTVLTWRETEWKQFDELKQSVMGLVQMCRQNQHVIIKQLDEKFRTPLELLKVKDLCEPQQYTPQTAHITSYAPLLTVLDLEDDDKESIARLNKYKSNKTFIALWSSMDTPDHAEKNIVLNDAVKDMLNPAIDAFERTYTSLKTGSIAFKVVDELFDHYKGRYKELREELVEVARTMNASDNKWVAARVKEVRYYHTLHRYADGAKVMLDLKTQFRLTGDFTVLQKILNCSTNKDDPLKTMAKLTLNDAGDILEEIDEPKQKCLKVYRDCKNLVDWLKDSLHDPGQLKVLVDLAMITASGQGNEEVHKVKILHAAVIGYAPLLYELDQNANFEKFLECCRSVWRALKSDPKLPDKLEYLSRHLTWLKKVKDSKGTLELNAFTQVKLINERGVCRVGNLHDIIPKTIDDALELTIKHKEDKGETIRQESDENTSPKVYTFAQLNDLQSKLMLVAGRADEGKEEVDRFVEIFDGVTRLASLYLKLSNAGSILFKKWNGTFYLDEKITVNARVDFGLVDYALQGTSNDVDVPTQISNTCSFLEQCLKEWSEHIELNRSEYLNLNYFTTEQLVILRNECASLVGGATCRYQNMVLAMLSSVRPDCRISNLQAAVKDAFVEIRSVEQSVLQEDECAIDADAENLDTDPVHGTKQEIEFIQELEASDIPTKLAYKALALYGVDKDQDAMLWCFEQMEESERVDSDDSNGRSAQLELDDESRESSICGSLENVASSLEALTSGLLNTVNHGDSLQDQMKRLWENYLTKVSSSVSDYLSVQHLGQVLDQLSRQVNKVIDRPFPEILKTGRPNLLVCPAAELLQTVMSLYMHGEGRDKPLPQRHEVLLCSKDTSAEDVELLLRLAANDDLKTFYCLVDVGVLTYDVALKTETSFEKYTKNKKDLRLVVVCSRETEDRSHIVTFMEQFRVPYTAPRRPQEIQEYLGTHFTHQIPNTAPMLDQSCSSVRVLKSHRAGVGKTLKVRRLSAKLASLHHQTNTTSACITIPLHKPQVDVGAIIKRLSDYMPDPDQKVSRIFHLDLAHEVQEGVDHFLFNLLVLGSVMDKDGTVWQRSNQDLYLVETMPLLQTQANKNGETNAETSYVHSILELLPSLICWSPVDCLHILQGNTNAMKRRYPNWRRNNRDQLMDDDQFRSQAFQRVYQYLAAYSRGATKSMSNEVDIRRVYGDHVECLKIFIQYCGITDPSWAELCHFVNFLNVQLHDCELSDFCHPEIEQDLPDFRNFVVKFMINMSRDFATRSLNISEETPGLLTCAEAGEPDDADLVEYIIKRRWEASPHPYIFFNADPHNERRHSMTFLGFIVDLNGDILDSKTNSVLDRTVLTRNLQRALQHNRVQLNENFEALSRAQKIERICLVVGMDMPHDPDPTYELTTDNVKKILAIHMRFRCQIPVVVMGETGCGKTRLVKFMCDLQKPPGAQAKSMVLMKVHGGTTDEDIIREVDRAAKLAYENRKDFPRMDTVLFFDEANTTDAIGLIKEIMCDRTIRGQPLDDAEGLKFVVACNPYRKHSDEVIKGLEQAGLGYHVKADATKDKLGRIPMRQLVYRVHALPQSMLPLVWDFGQLNQDIEEMYIRQMVLRAVHEKHVPNVPRLAEVMSTILSSSQEFMKQQTDECSFVSLRDVDRVIKVMAWFYKHRTLLFRKTEKDELTDTEDSPPDLEIPVQVLEDTTWALILALGVCYHACLQKREEYRHYVSPKFTHPLVLPDGADTIADEINRCQKFFLDQIQLGDNIAKNKALKENLFMMVICIELRIPLFLVGKPGSSKSLAKTIVADAMQRDTAQSELFKKLKLVHMISFQCSPLSRPDGIVGTFHQCAQLQEEKDLDQFVAVVVLDEVGLAEDSPLMPLKTLHPLLEDGCQGDDEPAPHKKVACIAISNWALDPAKMNRGIHVQRGVPNIRELEESAKGICSTDRMVQTQVQSLFQPLADGYLQLYKLAVEEKREFFGLRDFYSLVKMVYGFAKKSGEQPTWFELQHAILRNFGGLDKTQVDPVEIFDSTIQEVDKHAQKRPTDPDHSPSAMIKTSLIGDGLTSESRYLLIMTENYAALGILQQELLNDKKTTVIFGSSFPKDQEYTQVCRNINKIKVCMEAGRTVVLLNLENLYESLYDALNQYYVKLGGARFVDLGLGTQRLKCEVHESFKLVVVAEKEVVYEKFPIPLINRLEKHFLAMSNMLTQCQIRVVKRLETWVKEFCTELAFAGHLRVKSPRIGDVFIGYNVDTAASVIMQVCQKMLGGRREGDDEWAEQVFERAQDLLLQCATPDAVVRLNDTQSAFFDRYFDHQKHNNLCDLLLQEFETKDHEDGLFLQVTTHSKLLSNQDLTKLAKLLRLKKTSIKLAALQAFDTEHQFTKMLREFFENDQHTTRLLLLQCDSGHECSDLIACARYLIQDEYTQAKITASLVHVIFVIQLPKNGRSSFVGFQGGRWLSYHIDDLQPEQASLPPLKFLKERTISSIFAASPRLSKLTQEITVNIRPRNPELGDKYSAESSQMLTEDGLHDTNESLGHAGGFSDAETEIPNAPPSMVLPDDIFGRAKEVAPCGSKDDGMHIDSQDEMVMGQSLDMNQLIERCIHGAAAKIKDNKEDAGRKMKRVDILLKLLECNKKQYEAEDMTLDFMDVLSYRLFHLFKDKEETASTTQLASSWLRNEAASVEAVNKAGTFRRALWQYLEDRVTPMLAALVASADRNRNLDLLIRHDRSSWIHDFWLHMLLHLSITEITYKDLQTVLNRKELMEFQVETSGCDNSMFSVVLPFSWVIYNKMESLIYQATGGISDSEVTVLRILEKSQLGRVIETSTAEIPANEFNDMYLRDFVRMTYKSNSIVPDKEYKLIEDCIKRSAVEPSLTLPGIHLTYQKIKSRLHLCSQAFQIWPECINKLPDSTEETAAERTTKVAEDDEIMLEVKILDLILEELASKRMTLDDEKQHQTYRKDWMKKVDEFRLVIERILASVQNDDWTRSLPQCAKVRHMWTRISVVYMFIQHVCPSRASAQKGKTRIYSCQTLWKCLKADKNTDFKSEQALDSVEKFLKTCNSIASIIYFGAKNKKCQRCQETMNTPMTLPCDHVVCMTCIQDMTDIRDQKCHACKAIVPKDFTPRELQGKGEEIIAHNQYKQRCNAFFMDIVSRFCFDGEESPEPAVIHKLMGYVTCESKLSPDGAQVKQRTRGLTVFNDSIDPTPVVRSFLLQLLLRSKDKAVHGYLDEYFKRTSGLLEASDQIMELCLLCVHCLEDHHYVQLGEFGMADGRVQFTKNLMNEFKEALCAEQLSTVRLEAIAAMRFALSEVAEYVHAYYIKNDNRGVPAGMLSQLFKATEDVCTVGKQIEAKGVTPTSLFLMQQMRRRFGLNALKQIGNLPEVRWIIPDVARNTEGEATPDTYAILGDSYTVLREQVAEMAFGETPDKLQEEYQKCPVIQRERNLLLAVHSKITSLLIQPEELRPTEEVLASLEDVCVRDLGVERREILHRLFKNELGGACHQLTTRANQNVLEEELVKLILHGWIVLENIPRNQLSEPLVSLVVDTANVRNSFLPTMPDDHLDEVREALLRDRLVDENPVLYKCPKGHPYVITDCGRPYFEGICSECGSIIGGRGHEAHEGNVKIEDTKNRTSPGHILGRAAQRGDVPVPERLGPASTCALRMLVHMAMILGADKDPQITCQMLRPPGSVSPADTAQFLWEHLEVDLKLLGTALNKSPDEAVIVMHLILDKILSAQIPGVGRVNGTLSSMVERQQWEQKFSGNYIDPVLMNVNEKIATASNHLMNDTRLANNHLLKTLYEGEQTNTAPNINEILSEPAMWRGRFRVTIDHLSQQFQEYTGRVVQKRGRRGQAAEKKHDTLALFLQEEHQARALRFLPGIIKLQKILSQKFHRNIDKSEANKLTVRKFIEGHVEGHMRDEVRELIHSFAEAWELIKNKLGAFAVNGSLVPARYCEQSIGPGTSLSMLLPTPRGEGLCGTALVHYLVHVHNNIMENYARIAKQMLAAERSVSVQEVTQAHLVSYHPDRDLMPIILANCNYSLTAGQSTTIEYDYGGMEQQITERFIRGRSRIRPEVHTITFREDFTTEAAFSHLQSKIAQEPVLSANLQQHIKREHRHLTELNDSLAPLNKAIEFMITVGGDKDTPLLDFIENTLRMPSGCLRNAAQGCRLKHTQALWLLLSHERAKHLALGDQDVFGNIEDMYKEELPTEAEEALTTCFLHLASLELFHSYLFEYIVLKLAVRQNGNDEDYVDNTKYPLNIGLNEHVADREHTEIQALTNGNFPEEIPLKYSVATWKLAYRVLKERA